MSSWDIHRCVLIETKVFISKDNTDIIFVCSVLEQINSWHVELELDIFRRINSLWLQYWACCWKRNVINIGWGENLLLGDKPDEWLTMDYKWKKKFKSNEPKYNHDHSDSN